MTTWKSPVSRVRRAGWILLLGIIVAAAGITLVSRSLQESLLRAIGRALVASEQVFSADVIVVSLDSGGAGALEAADLVQRGIAKRVAVFMDPPRGEDHEFIRRGLPYEDAGARQIRQLRSLGITNIVQIATIDGTESEGHALSAWCKEQRFDAIVFVVTSDHSRRAQRVLSRIMKNTSIRIVVQPARYSSFDPERWWETRGGIRIAIIEMQKLILDLVLH
ncbi:MAG: hypothetical protein KIT82_05155 [Bradyrhizobium sp.]|nr:hypothetical protein [Bradyrhizobium sp.]